MRAAYPNLYFNPVGLCEINAQTGNLKQIAQVDHSAVIKIASQIDSVESQCKWRFYEDERVTRNEVKFCREKAILMVGLFSA